jgi:phosphotransferase system HPr-like phosphotransfer protein
MSLAVTQGTEIRFTAKGPDAKAVLDALVELFDTDFGLSEAPGA